MSYVKAKYSISARWGRIELLLCKPIEKSNLETYWLAIKRFYFIAPFNDCVFPQDEGFTSARKTVLIVLQLKRWNNAKNDWQQHFHSKPNKSVLIRAIN